MQTKRNRTNLDQQSRLSGRVVYTPRSTAQHAKRLFGHDAVGAAPLLASDSTGGPRCVLEIGHWEAPSGRQALAGWRGQRRSGGESPERVAAGCRG